MTSTDNSIRTGSGTAEQILAKVARGRVALAKINQS